MRWGPAAADDGVVERPFWVPSGDRTVPGLLWTPVRAVGPRPLVLVGHGASGSKREGYVVTLARQLVRSRGYAAAAIDGPVHGERRPDADAPPMLVLLEFSQLWAADPTMTDRMVADWRATIDALECLEGIGPGPVGYWGLSMGTILGLPLAAADRRIGVAVLGLMGLTGPSRERIALDAPRIRCPLLFLVQWDDEMFERQAAGALFDLFGSADKRLHAYPGRHGQVPDEAFAASEAFLARQLEVGVP
ncbi:MAG TPA: dienelactone hydrolase family protein [Acidimicrobiales bacterium]|jgi:dienelactone hydrolase